MKTAVLVTTVCSLASLLGACSMFDPKNTNPYCGESIPIQSVQIIDMTSYQNPDAQLDGVLRELFEDYRLVTEKPVQIPRDYAYQNRNNVTGIAGAKSEASQWGCNLLVLMQVKAARTGVSVQARNEDKAWMVHVGTAGKAR